MPTYITLGTYTQQGIENMKESPDRLDDVRAALSAAGGELKAFYLVMGQYDFVAVASAPNDQTAATLALSIGAHGNVRTETLRAFDEEEYREVVAALP